MYQTEQWITSRKPGLFNIYITYILEHLVINPNIDIAVFADNWVLAIKTLSKQQFFLEIQNINAQLFEYPLTFTMEEVEIAEVNETVDKPITNKNEELDAIKEQCQEVKFLGVKYFLKW